MGFEVWYCKQKGKLSNQEIKKIKHLAKKNNTFIDTANAYGDCEMRIGLNFKEFNLITNYLPPNHLLIF